MIDQEDFQAELSDQQQGVQFQLGHSVGFHDGFEKALQHIRGVLTDAGQECGTREEHTLLNKIWARVRELSCGQC
jgi:hypothetical protein